MVNYACSFNQSETGKHFEWMNNTNYVSISIDHFNLSKFISYYKFLTMVEHSGSDPSLENRKGKKVYMN